MHRRGRPDIPASVRRAVEAGPQKREDELFRFRRSSTLPADLHIGESPAVRGALQQRVRLAIPDEPSTRKISGLSPILERAVAEPTTSPRINLTATENDVLDHSSSPSVGPSESASQAQEQTAADEGYRPPYVESVDAADDDEPGRTKYRRRASSDPRDESKWLEKEPSSIHHSAPVGSGVRRVGSEEDETDSTPSTSIEERENSTVKKAEIRRRLKTAGLTANQIEAVFKEDKIKKQEPVFLPVHEGGRPTYAKVHRKYISLDTLGYYEIPWEYDRTDPDYIIILREMDKYETDVLFEHTRILREKAGRIPPEAPEGRHRFAKESPAYAWYRKRDRTSTRIKKARILETRTGRLGLVDDDIYDLPIVPYIRDSLNEKARDRDLEEAAKRFRLNPDFNIKRSEARCLSAVDRSHYVPNGTSGEYLLALTERKVYAQEEAGLFRRRHMQLPELDFKKFTLGILELYEDEEIERVKIFMHLEEAQKTFEKRPVPAQGLKRIDPYWLTTGQDDFEITSCCVPFFHLRQYGSLAESTKSTPSTQRPQTLLQMRYSGADKQQDLRQVVCQKLGGNQCLHVSYIWAIIINNDTLVIASLLSESELLRVSDLKSEPGSPPSLWPQDQIIHVQGPDDAIWLLDRTECRTWFEFALHFDESTFSLEEGAIVQHDGKSILPSKWSPLFDEMRNATLKLRIYHPDDAPEGATQAVDAQPRLEIEMGVPNPIGSAIAARFDPSYNRRRNNTGLDRATRTEPWAGHGATEESEMQEYLKNLQLDIELALYRDCPPMSFEALLAHITQDEPTSQHGREDRSSSVHDELAGPSNVPGLAETDGGSEDHIAPVPSQNNAAGGNNARARNGDDSPCITSNDSLPAVDRADISTVVDSTKASGPDTNDSSGGAAESGSGDAQSSKDGEIPAEEHDTPQSQPVSDTERDHVDGDKIRGLSRSSTIPSLTKEAAFLAEGICALLYVFVEDQRKPDECGEKLCGAIYTFIHRLDAGLSSPWDSDERRTNDLRAISFFNDMTGLLNIAKVLQAYEFGTGILRNTLDVSPPESFKVAMRSATLAIILANSTDTGAVEGTSISHWAVEAERSLYDTFYGVLQSLQKPPLISKAAARPKDVLANIACGVTGRILPDISPEGYDLQRIYNEYIRTLEHEVRAEQPSRWPVKHLRNLRYELEAIYEQLESQWVELGSLNNRLLLSNSALDNFPKDSSKSKIYIVSPDDRDDSARNYTSKTLANALEAAKERYNQFETLQTWATELLDEAIAQTADIDDWRNNAIVIFTIITILFLPLSFVASVFGMNTVDFRNLAHGQWLYWVSALPLTAFVVAITIWWSDLLPLQRFFNFWKERSVKQ